MTYGAIEAGGTKFFCAVGSGPNDLKVSDPIPTTTPKQTLAQVGEFFKGRKLRRIGVACFGPLEIASGRIGKLTPKLAWRGFAIQQAIENITASPVTLDTDVNGAALGELQWGAARDQTDFVYVTIGTGIGGGSLCGGSLIHGALHPEIGHMRVRRFAGDAFEGACPVHGDCLEGLASGPAIAARAGVAKAEDLSPNHPAWFLTAHYLGQMVVNLTCAYSPRLIILGGGIGLRPGMLDLVRQAADQEMNGYVKLPKLARAKLGANAGPLGALALAMRGDTAKQRR
jgi:fructokinase